MIKIYPCICYEIKTIKSVDIFIVNTIRVTKNKMYSRNYVKKKLLKSSGHESTLYKSIYPLVIIFRSFGISPYKFNDRKKLVISYKNMIYTFLFITIYTLCMWSVWRKLTGIDRNGKSIFGQIEIFKVKMIN